MIDEVVVPPRIVGKEEFIAEGVALIPSLNESHGALILIDKPYGITSFDAVYKIKRTLRLYSGDKKVKVGHGGTLDPLATGLLIIGTRKATKVLNELLVERKTYYVTFRLGITSPSFDLETQIVITNDLSTLTESSVISAVESSVGEQLQVPPQFSAVKVNGKPLYEHARKGREIELAPKPITIYNVSDVSVRLPYLSFSVECSKGTYIRAIARDIGEKLGVGAVVTVLRRTHIGMYDVSNALGIMDVEALRSHQESLKVKE